MAAQSYDIPNEVIDKILLSLPAKSLLRFKRVCKRWYNLITDDDFIKMHTNHNHNHNHNHHSNKKKIVESMVLFSIPYTYNISEGGGGGGGGGSLHRLNPSESVEKIGCPFDSNKYCYDILGSCNGLVCFCLTTKMAPVVLFVDEFCVWNPCTGEFKMFHNPSIPGPTNNHHFYNYRFPNPPIPILTNNQHHFFVYRTYGFGYDQSIDEYKLVSNVYHDLRLVSIQVYTLGGTSSSSSSSSAWKNIDVLEPQKFYPSANRYEDQGLCVNGALYSIAKESQSRLKIIICFDIKTERYRKVTKPWPPHEDVFMEIMNLGILDGCICMTGRDMNQKYSVDVWMMKEEEESWIRYFTITTPVIAFKGLVSLKPLRRFCDQIQKNGDVLMMVDKKFLVRYEPERDVASYLGWCSDVKLEYATEATYTESLVSLKSGIYMSSRSSSSKAAAGSSSSSSRY